MVYIRQIYQLKEIYFLTTLLQQRKMNHKFNKVMLFIIFSVCLLSYASADRIQAGETLSTDHISSTGTSTSFEFAENHEQLFQDPETIAKERDEQDQTYLEGQTNGKYQTNVQIQTDGKDFQNLRILQDVIAIIEINETDFNTSEQTGDYSDIPFIVPVVPDIQEDPNIEPPVSPAPSDNSTSDLLVPSQLNYRRTELDTYMTDHYNYFVTSHGNRVWAGAINLMWDEMKRTLLNCQNSSFSNVQNVIQQKLLQNLEQGQFSKNDISDRSYYVMSGFGQQTVDKINLEVRQKFPKRTFQDLNLQLGPTNFISYAYIYKHLEFITVFEDNPYFQFNGEGTPGFSAEKSKQKKQLYYKYYNSDDDFLLGIETKNPNDQLLLLKSPFTEVNNFRFEKSLNWWPCTR